MSNDIENIFKEKFENFEAAPRAGLFEAIQAKRKKKRRAIWIWSSAAILLAGFGLWHLTSSLEENINLANESSIQTERNVTEEKAAEQNYISEQQESPRAPEKDQFQMNRSEGKGVVASHTTKTEYLEHSQKEKASKNKNTKKQSNDVASTRKIVNSELADLFEKISDDKNESTGKGKLYFGNKEYDVDKAPIFDSNKDLNQASEQDNPSIVKTEDTDSDLTVSKETIDQVANNTTLPIHRLVELSKWSIEASASPGIGNRRLSGEQEYISLRNESENPKLSYAFDIRTLYQLSPKLNIQLGLNATIRNEQFDYTTSNKIITTEREETKYETVIHPVLGEIIRKYTVVISESEEVSGLQTRTNNKFTNITIPIELEWELWKRNRITLIGKGGLTAGIYSNAQGSMILDPDKVVSLHSSPYKKAGIHSANAGLGIAVQATRRISLIAYPQVRIGLNSSYSNNSAFSQKETGIYTHVGLRIRL
ncbi:hypothetical protein OAD66_00910 [Bacteroidia bacterium]|nr:hypothetical protein [Bacteroidia bacterium]MDB9881685.1 hypothetical protein [Bacteroidia bacterium]